MIGSQLEEIVQVTATYEEMKAEILVAYGEMPEKKWAELANDRQGEESFRHYCTRVRRRFEDFLTLARGGDSAVDVTNTVVKHLVL